MCRATCNIVCLNYWCDSDTLFAVMLCRNLENRIDILQTPTPFSKRRLLLQYFYLGCHKF